MLITAERAFVGLERCFSARQSLAFISFIQMNQPKKRSTEWCLLGADALKHSSQQMGSSPAAAAQASEAAAGAQQAAQLLGLLSQQLHTADLAIPAYARACSDILTQLFCSPPSGLQPVSLPETFIACRS